MTISASLLLDELKQKNINYISFCFTDIHGTFHRLTYDTTYLSDKQLREGIGFDGSSIRGWKEIHHSDTLLVPDLSTTFMDPFTAEPCMMVMCNVVDPITNEGYLRDPYTIAKKAEAYLSKSKIADTAFFGPELEFFVMDSVQFGNDAHNTFYKLDCEEGPFNNGKDFGERGNLAHRPDYKGGYFPAQPMDSLFDLRAEICHALRAVGVKPTLHHHEVAVNQCEIGFMHSHLLESANNVQKFKYAAKNVAASFGKSVTFMPKPIYGDNGSGMHTHQSLWKNNATLFHDKDGYAELSEMAIYYIGGIIKHAKAINAFTNPTTNSYKRLIPGYEAPVNLAYSAHNRSAAIRIPYSSTANAKRIEVRFPDPTTNPYLAFAAMLMAGLDGIKNKIHPGEAVDKNLFDLDEDDHTEVPSVCGSLEEALAELHEDREFLLEGDVFTDDFIDTYIDLKMDEAMEVGIRPHPYEYKLYYSS